MSKSVAQLIRFWDGKFHDEQTVILDGELVSLSPKEKKTFEQGRRFDNAYLTNLINKNNGDLTIDVPDHTPTGKGIVKLKLEYFIGYKRLNKDNNASFYKIIPYEIFPIIGLKELSETNRQYFIDDFIGNRQVSDRTTIFKLCYKIGEDKFVHVGIKTAHKIFFLNREPVNNNERRIYHGLGLDFESTYESSEKIIYSNHIMDIKEVWNWYDVNLKRHGRFNKRCIKEINGAFWNPLNQCWVMQKNEDTTQQLFKASKKIDLLSKINELAFLLLLDGKSCDTPTYPNVWYDYVGQRVAIINYYGERETITEIYRRVFEGANTWGHLRTSEEHQPEKLNLGTVIEVVYDGGGHGVYRKEQDGSWMLLGDDLWELIDEGIELATTKRLTDDYRITISEEEKKMMENQGLIVGKDVFIVCPLINSENWSDENIQS